MGREERQAARDQREQQRELNKAQREQQRELNKAQRQEEGKGQTGDLFNIGLAGLEEAPRIFQSVNNKVENESDVMDNVTSMTQSGAKIGAAIGTAIVPGAGTAIGSAIGGVVGTGAGLATTIGWRGDLLKKKDKETVYKTNEERAELWQNYYLEKSSDQILTDKKLLAKSLGYNYE